MSYHIRLNKDYLVFSSAHFVTFNGDVCETLHGHNFRVSAEIAGGLDGDYFVVDFVMALEVLRKLVLELDHRVLLPTRHALIQVHSEGESVEATFRERRWVFPAGDCVLLDVENTSAELLARYLCHRFRDALAEKMDPPPTRVSIEVDECNGQAASFTWTP